MARPPTLMPARCVSTKDSSSSGSSASPELVDASSVKAWLRRSWARVQGDLVAGDREVAALMFVSEERGIREPAALYPILVHWLRAGERV